MILGSGTALENRAGTPPFVHGVQDIEEREDAEAWLFSASAPTWRRVLSCIFKCILLQNGTATGWAVNSNGVHENSHGLGIVGRLLFAQQQLLLVPSCTPASGYNSYDRSIELDYVFTARSNL